jgi:hypothetical protein
LPFVAAYVSVRDMPEIRGGMSRAVCIAAPDGLVSHTFLSAIRGGPRHFEIALFAPKDRNRYARLIILRGIFILTPSPACFQKSGPLLSTACKIRITQTTALLIIYKYQLISFPSNKIQLFIGTNSATDLSHF